MGIQNEQTRSVPSEKLYYMDILTNLVISYIDNIESHNQLLLALAPKKTHLPINTVTVITCDDPAM